jgi:hypothetical protein
VWRQPSEPVLLPALSPPDVPSPPLPLSESLEVPSLVVLLVSPSVLSGCVVPWSMVES